MLPRMDPNALELDKRVDIERLLAEMMEGVAPLVALGEPGEHEGAGRATVAEAEWHDAVTDLLRTCRYAFVLPSYHAGTVWEIDHIMTWRLHVKTIFIMPSSDPELRIDMREHWVRAAEALAACCKITLPPYDPEGGFFTLQADGTVGRLERPPLLYRRLWSTTAEVAEPAKVVEFLKRLLQPPARATVPAPPPEATRETPPAPFPVASRAAPPRKTPSYIKLAGLFALVSVAWGILSSLTGPPVRSIGRTPQPSPEFPYIPPPPASTTAPAIRVQVPLSWHRWTISEDAYLITAPDHSLACFVGEKALDEPITWNEFFPANLDDQEGELLRKNLLPRIQVYGQYTGMKADSEFVARAK